MDPMLDDFRAVTEGLTFHAPELPIVSNLTGQLAGDEIATPDYWVQHAREAVRFADGVRALEAQGVARHFELGPDSTLTALTRMITDASVTPALRAQRPEPEALAGLIAHAQLSGLRPDWRALHPGARAVDLPTYAFQHQHYWLAAQAAAETQRAPAADRHRPGRGQGRVAAHRPSLAQEPPVARRPRRPWHRAAPRHRADRARAARRPGRRPARARRAHAAGPAGHPRRRRVRAAGARPRAGGRRAARVHDPLAAGRRARVVPSRHRLPRRPSPTPRTPPRSGRRRAPSPWTPTASTTGSQSSASTTARRSRASRASGGVTARSTRRCRSRTRRTPTTTPCTPRSSTPPSTPRSTRSAPARSPGACRCRSRSRASRCSRTAPRRCA